MNSTKCTICRHPQIVNINREIEAGGGLAQLAREYSVSYSSLYAHAQNHVAKNPTREQHQQRAETIEDIVINKGRLDKMLEQSIAKGHTPTALKILAELRAYNEQWLRISSTNLQLRVQELECELAQYHNGTSDAEDADYAQRIKILTTPELKMLIRIQNKVASQDAEDVIIAEGTQFSLTYAQLSSAVRRIPKPGRLNGNSHKLLDDEE